jgi:hypothetical protein
VSGRTEFTHGDTTYTVDNTPGRMSVKSVTNWEVLSGATIPGPLLPTRPRWDQVFDLIQLARTHPHLTPAEVVDKWVALREAQRG